MKTRKDERKKPERIVLPNPRGAQYPPLPILRFDPPNFGVPENLEVKHLAPEERVLLRKSVVDFSTASEFLKKHVEVVCELHDHVAHVGGEKYRLSAEMLRSILIHRHFGAGNEYPNPADRLAQAVYWCAKSLAFERSFLTERSRDRTLAWQDYLTVLKGKESANLRAKGFVQVPVQADGKVLERWSQPELPRLTIHFAFNTELSRVYANGLPPGVVDVRNTVVPDEKTEGVASEHPITIERLPELTIKLEGAPVAKMMVSSLLKTVEAQEFTRKLLAGTTHELNRFLGLAEPRGRPSLGIGEKAAKMLDYEKKPMRKALTELCPDRDKPAHQHNRACEDRVRLAARQYYQSLRRNFRRYLVAEVKKA